MRVPRKVGLSLLAATAGWLGCDEPPPQVEILRPVRSETVYASGGARTRTFSGTARAGQETELSFRVSGAVERIDVRVGQQVRPGQLIALLDARDYELKEQQSRANLDQALATARNAESNLERVRELYEDRNASRNELDSARANAEAAQAQVESARKQLEADQRRLGFTRLTSPVRGAIALIPVEVNENVTQGQTVVLLTSGSRPEVEVAMPEVLIAQIREGASTGVTFDAIPDTAFEAVVTEVGVAATGTATTFPVTVRLVEDDAAIRSGMAANVSFRFDEGAGGGEAIHVPAVSVGEDREGRFVFVVGPSGEAGVGIVRRRAVEVRRELLPDGTIHVLKGLAEGERVVTAGVRRLRDGQRVRWDE